MTDQQDQAAPTAEHGRPDQCGEWTPVLFRDQLSTTWCIRWPGHGIPHRDQNGCEWREVW